MAAKHTPGPWRPSTGNSRWIVADKGGCIACVELSQAHGEANARLIAAAPELLAALELVISSAHPNAKEHPSMHRAWEVSRAAIAKAKGPTE